MIAVRGLRAPLRRGGRRCAFPSGRSRRASAGWCSGPRAAARPRCCTSSPACCGRAKATCAVVGENIRRAGGPPRSTAGARATVGIVLQALHLVKHLSVRDNLRLAQYLAHAPQDDARIADTLGALGVAAKAARRAERAVAGRAAARRDRARGGEPARSCCSPTSRPRTSTTPAAARAVELLAEQAARVRRDAGRRDARRARQGASFGERLEL